MNATLNTTVDYWVGRIMPSLDRAAEAWIQAGVDLNEAKAAVGHGQFGRVVAELGMSPSTATRIMAIARNPVLADRAHGHALPPSWRTLAELARLDDDELAGAIGEGLVHPEMTRGDAARLVAGGPQPDEDEHHEDQEHDRAGRVLPEHKALVDMIDASIDVIRAGFAQDAPGVARLRVLDALMRGVPEADDGDHEIKVTLLAIAIHCMDGMPPADEGDDPVGQLSATISAALPHLWGDDPAAIVRALAVLTIKAVAVPVELRPHMLLQLLDGRPVDQVHPTTRLVVDAVLAGFAVEVPA